MKFLKYLLLSTLVVRINRWMPFILAIFCSVSTSEKERPPNTNKTMLLRDDSAETASLRLVISSPWNSSKFRLSLIE